MEDKTILDNNQERPLGEGQSSLDITDELQELINAIAEEVVLQGTSFDSQKALLKRTAEAEGMDYGKLEISLKNFFKAMSDYESKGGESYLDDAASLARNCGFSQDFVDKLIITLDHKRIEAQSLAEKEALKKEKDRLAAEKAKKEQERKIAEEEKKKIQDQLKKTEEEAKAQAKAAEEALKKEKERLSAEKAKQEAEKKAAEEEKKKLEAKLKKAESKAKADAMAAEEALKKEKAKLASEKAERERQQKNRRRLLVLIVVLLLLAVGILLLVRSCGGSKEQVEEPVVAPPVETPVVETPVTEQPTIEAPIAVEETKQEKPKKAETSNSKPASTQSSQSNASIKWNGAATYSGPSQSGQPNGIGGTLTFTRDYQLDMKDGRGTMLEIKAGETIENTKFDNGKLRQGELHRKDGTRKWFSI